MPITDLLVESFLDIFAGFVVFCFGILFEREKEKKNKKRAIEYLYPILRDELFKNLFWVQDNHHLRADPKEPVGEPIGTIPPARETWELVKLNSDIKYIPHTKLIKIINAYAEIDSFYDFLVKQRNIHGARLPKEVAGAYNWLRGKTEKAIKGAWEELQEDSGRGR